MIGRLRRPDLWWSIALTMVILGPALLRSGYVLRGDMVFVPRQPWKIDWVGGDGSFPRAVPMDALVSVATDLVAGETVQRIILVATILLGSLGAARLVRDHSALARLAASVAFVWNPWVDQRLAIGQWSFVLGLVVLVWAIPALVRMRVDPRRGWPAMLLWLVVAACTGPSTGLIAVLVAVVMVGSGGVGRGGVTLLAGGVANLPWLVPALLRPGGAGQPSGQFEAFAARAESSAGLVASLLGTGGIWKASVVAAERTVPLIVLLTAGLTLLSLLGLRWQRSLDRPALVALVGVAVASLLVAALPGIPAAAHLLDRITDAWSPVAMLRDSHRFLAPFLLLIVVGVAGLVDRLVEVSRVLGAVKMVAVAIVILPVLTLPSMAWGLGGRLRPVHYPAEWDVVAGIIAGEQPAVTVVLPWRGGYRGFDWNHLTATLDPAPRFFPGRVLIDDRLYLGETVIDSEDELHRRLTTLLGPRVGDGDADADAADPVALRRAGVRFVLIHQRHGGVRSLPGTPRHAGHELVLYDLGPATGTLPAGPSVAAIVVGWGVFGAGVATAVAELLRRRRQAAGRDLGGSDHDCV